MRIGRLLPDSLIGRIALVMAAALLMAQGINFVLLRAERQRVVQAQIEGPVMSRFVASAARLTERDRERPGGGRRARVAWGEESVVPADAVDAGLTERLRASAAGFGLAISDARAALSDALPPPSREARRRGLSDAERRRRFRTLLLSVRVADGRWVNGQLLAPRPSPQLLTRLLAGTVLIYLLLLVAVVLVAARLTRPLRDLTQAAQRFGGQAAAPPLTERGPADVRRAIEAFNAMGARVTSLVEEKDRMLGAIGHDLRTPLASLRIRAEGMDPPEERARMVATIEEMAALLDDTLALARSGQSKEPVRAVDLAALVDAVAEEYRAAGKEVTFAAGERLVAAVRPHLLRRAIRNLVDNAVSYAGSATLRVDAGDEAAVIEVADRGPGIPADQLQLVREPFVRLEGSRSRATGGSGLGIALAQAAAALHGGELELANRAGGGLVARLVVPIRTR